jgi:hypothetical protein
LKKQEGRKDRKKEFSSEDVSGRKKAQKREKFVVGRLGLTDERLQRQLVGPQRTVMRPSVLSHHESGSVDAMKQNEASDPLQVCLLGADAVVANADELTHLIEQPWRTRLHARCRHNFLPESLALTAPRRHNYLRGSHCQSAVLFCRTPSRHLVQAKE